MIYKKLRQKFGQNSKYWSGRTIQLNIHVGFECVTFKSRERIHFDCDPWNRLKILFFGDSKAKSKNFSKKLWDDMPSFFLVNLSHKSLFYLEKPRRRYNLENNSFSFVSSLLIGPIIRHSRFFVRIENFCSNISER
jgi:hypothetical protein